MNSKNFPQFKVKEGMKDFLGCEIEIEGENYWIKQTRIIERLEE